MRPAIRRRIREAVPSAVLAAVVFVPLLLTRPGRVGADTKTYLYLDPERMLGRAPDMWDPHIGLGTVTHQNIGYLWPIGPYYRLCEALGMPDWVAQRIWLGAILLLAGIGVRFMLKAMGQEGPHVTAATFCYALTPYVLTLAARLSVILLPYAGLPWLIGLTVIAVRKQRWREPALFALVVATIGSVNATALILACVGPITWIATEVFVLREVRLRDALKAGLRITAITIPCSLWWLAGLWAQGGYGIEILRYTETARTVAAASVSLEVLRGLGYWFFYGDDRYGPWVSPSRWYTMKVPILVTSFVLPGLGLMGAAVARFRDRAFFAALLVIGMILAVGAHPWTGSTPVPRVVRSVLESDAGLSMRSLPRAAPLVVLATSVFVGALVASIGARRPPLARPLTAGVMVIAVLNLSPLWMGRMVDPNLDRAEEIPAWWDEAASFLDSRDDGTRVLELPGADFASYRWGNTVDPILPGIMDRPYAARELIPYGSPASADLLNAFDRRFQELIAEPAAVAPVARVLGVGDISVRSDLSFERYNTPRPRNLWALLDAAPDIEVAAGFGPADPNRPRADLPLRDEIELTTPPDLPHPPEVGVLEVMDAEPIVRTAGTDHPIIVSGSGDGIVDLAAAGLIRGDELLLYSATFHGQPDGLLAAAGAEPTLVLTDSNRRRGTRWGTVRDTHGYTERADEEPLEADPSDQRLDIFGTDDPATQTVAVARGGVAARASTYGNVVSLTPEDRAGQAIDGDLQTAWRTGGFADAEGDSVELRFEEPVTTDRVRLVQALGGVRNRTITEVSVRLDGGEPMRFHLDDSSRPETVEADDPSPGQTLTFPSSTFEEMEITIERTDPHGLLRFDGISGVGFAEIVVEHEGAPLVADETVRLPTDLLDSLGDAALDHPLAIVLTRQRTAGVIAVRSSPEKHLARLVELPSGRGFHLSAQVRLTDSALADDLLDGALGIPLQFEGGVTATSSRRLPGGNTNRAMAAIDGDPTTWWSPGFLDQHGDEMRFKAADPVEVREMTIVVVNDGRHSVPRSLDVAVGDGFSEPVVQRVSLGDLPDQDAADGTVAVEVALPEAVTGTDITVTIPDDLPAVRDVWTSDYFSGDMVPMPVGIAELGIEGLEAPAMPVDIDDRCRDDLLQVDGEPVPVRLIGTTAELLAGEAVEMRACDDAPIFLDAGVSSIETAVGALAGFDVDRLVLRSSAGGDPDPSAGALVAPGDVAAGRPEVIVERSGSTSLDLRVPVAEEDFWLVLGQSVNAGWNATADGADLGAPILVDGFANGWLVPAGTDIEVHLEWAPQRVVRMALWASVLALVVAAAMILAPRRRAGADAAFVPLDARPSMPKAFDANRILRYAGPRPGGFASVLLPVGSLLAGLAVIGPWAGVVLGTVAASAIRFPRIRPVMTLGGPAIIALCVGYVCARQLLAPFPGGFDWPGYFGGLHRPAWLGVALVVLDVLVDRCWLRRWWPSGDSPA